MDGLTLMLALAVAQAPATHGNDSVTALPVVPGAVDVIQSATGGAKFVEYAVRESYPAPRTIAALLDLMAKRGWKTTQRGEFKPPQWRLVTPVDPSRGNVRAAFSATPVASHTWLASWRDASGRGATVELEYQCPLEDQRLHSVWVHVRGGVFGPAETARQEEARRHAHDELCQAARDSGRPPDPSCGN